MRLRWLTAAELQNMDSEAQTCLLDLARRGVLLCDPAPESLNDLVSGEQTLDQMQWLDVAAVFPIGDAADADAGIAFLGEVGDDRGVRGAVAEGAVDGFADVVGEAGDFAVAMGDYGWGIHSFLVLG